MWLCVAGNGELQFQSSDQGLGVGKGTAAVKKLCWVRLGGLHVPPSGKGAASKTRADERIPRRRTDMRVGHGEMLRGY